MNRYTIWLMALALYATPAFCINAELLKDTGLILEMEKHADDSKTSNIRWHLTMPDGTILHKVGESERGSPCYYLLSADLKRLVRKSGDDYYLDVRVHGKKPMILLNNRLASCFNVGQNQFSFDVRFHLDSDLQFSTNPESPIPMLADIRYSIKSLTKKYAIKMFMRTYRETKELWELYLTNEQNVDVVDGTAETGAMKEDTLLGMYTEASVAGEMIQNTQFDYVTSPAGL